MLVGHRDSRALYLEVPLKGYRLNGYLPTHSSRWERPPLNGQKERVEQKVQSMLRWSIEYRTQLYGPFD